MMSMFKGGDGKISMMRVSTFTTVAVILGTFVAHNVVSMSQGNGFVSMGFQEAALVAAAMGMKAAQTFAEVVGSKKKEEVPEPQETQEIPSGKGE